MLLILCALSSVAGVAEGLEILNIEWRTALINGDDMVDHLGGSQTTRFETLLAHRLLLQLQGSELSPRGVLVELGVVVAVALEGFPLRQPGAMCCSLQFRHRLDYDVGIKWHIGTLGTKAFHSDNLLLRKCPG